MSSTSSPIAIIPTSINTMIPSIQQQQPTNHLQQSDTPSNSLSDELSSSSHDQQQQHYLPAPNPAAPEPLPLFLSQNFPNPLPQQQQSFYIPPPGFHPSPSFHVQTLPPPPPPPQQQQQQQQQLHHHRYHAPPPIHFQSNQFHPHPHPHSFTPLQHPIPFPFHFPSSNSIQHHPHPHQALESPLHPMFYPPVPFPFPEMHGLANHLPPLPLPPSLPPIINGGGGWEQEPLPNYISSPIVGPPIQQSISQSQPVQTTRTTPASHQQPPPPHRPNFPEPPTSKRDPYFNPHNVSNIYIRPFTPTATDQTILELCSEFGIIKSVKAIMEDIPTEDIAGKEEDQILPPLSEKRDCGQTISPSGSLSSASVATEPSAAVDARCATAQDLLKIFPAGQITFADGSRQQQPDLSTAAENKPGRSRRCKGYGFCCFSTVSEARKAIGGLGQKGITATFARESLTVKLRKLADDDSTNLYLQNIPFSWNDKDLIRFFHPHQVLSVRILLNTDGPPDQDPAFQSSSVSRGIAFARLTNRLSAIEAIKQWHGIMLVGAIAPLQIRFADSEAQKTFKSVINYDAPWIKSQQYPTVPPRAYDPNFLDNGYEDASSVPATCSIVPITPQNSALSFSASSSSQDTSPTSTRFGSSTRSIASSGSFLSTAPSSRSRFSSVTTQSSESTYDPPSPSQAPKILYPKHMIGERGPSINEIATANKQQDSIDVIPADGDDDM